MSIRFTLTFMFFSSIIVLCHSALKVTKNEYNKDWKCNRICQYYLAGHRKYVDQACSIFNGTQGGCKQKQLYLYKNENDEEGFFEKHHVLICNASDGTKYLTSGTLKDEYLEWNSQDGDKLYPSGFVNYVPDDVSE